MFAPVTTITTIPGRVIDVCLGSTGCCRGALRGLEIEWDVVGVGIADDLKKEKVKAPHQYRSLAKDPPRDRRNFSHFHLYMKNAMPSKPKQIRKPTILANPRAKLSHPTVVRGISSIQRQ